MSTSLSLAARPDRAVLSDHVDHPSGFLALSPRNLRFCVPGISGFVPFRRQGHHRLVPGGVQAPADCRAELLDAFLRDSARDSDEVVALQVRARDVALFRSRGFRVDAFGSSFALGLGTFTFAGTKRMKLRNRIKRARDAGVTEFLRKPFSAQHVESRPKTIPGAPREFISATAYTGPDRRRRTGTYSGKERRSRSKSETAA